jgi:FkbM family methyltransferase
MISNLRKYPRLKSFLKKIIGVLKDFSPYYRLTKSIRKETSSILPKVNCIDVGASFSPHPPWEVFRMSDKTLWLAVEPNVQNLFYLAQWSWPSKVKAVEMGLSETGGKQTLFVTNVDTGSSLCEPVVEKSNAHRLVHSDYFFPYKKVLIDTLTLESLISSAPADKGPVMVKLDTQGSEFSILKGVSKAAIENRFICVELENTLLAQPFMKGATPFYEVYEFFEKAGFELVYLNPIYMDAPVVKHKLRSSFVLNECDAVFLLRNDIAKSRDLSTQLAMVGCYVSYALYGEALNMLSHISSQPEYPKDLKDRCGRIIKQLSAI